VGNPVGSPRRRNGFLRSPRFARWPSCRAAKAARMFCPLSGDGHFVGIQRPWQRIRGAAGLHNVRIHDLRHSFASIAVSGGDSLYLVGKVLGPHQSRTTERYAHLKDDPLRAVANRTSERIAAIMQNGGDTKVVTLPPTKAAE
jgi:integrase